MKLWSNVEQTQNNLKLCSKFSNFENEANEARKAAGQKNCLLLARALLSMGNTTNKLLELPRILVLLF